MKTNFLNTIKENKLSFSVLIIIWIIYSALTLLAPAVEAGSRYSVTLLQINLLRVTLLLPYLLIWMSGLFAFLHFHSYQSFLGKSPEASGFKKLTKAIGFLLAVVIIPLFVSLYGTYHADSYLVQKTITILRNNLTVIFYLISFYYLWGASSELITALIKDEKKLKPKYEIVSIITALLGLILIFLILHNPFRSTSSNPLIRPTYYLSDWSIFITIIIPYLLVWLLGLLAIINIKTLANEVSGVIYKKTFNSISRALIILISLVISLQFLSQASTFFAHASLGIILSVVYALLLLIAGAYLYLAKAAKQLTAIEKI